MAKGLATEATKAGITALSVSYSLVSVLMVFVNKLILNPSSIITPTSLLIVQCAVSAVVLGASCTFLRVPIRLPLIDLVAILVVNASYMGMMLSSSFSLNYLSVHMVTLFKCLSVVATAIGDSIFIGTKQSMKGWLSIALIVIGSVFGALTDIQFSIKGYLWMIASIVTSSAYVILTRLIITSRNIHYFTAAFWNNTLAAVNLYLFLSLKVGPFSFFKDMRNVCTGEVQWENSPGFILFSGIVGIVLNALTYSLLGLTSATSYVVVGAAKKVIQAALSMLVYPESSSLANMFSITIGLTGATLYAFNKDKKSDLNTLVSVDYEKSREP